VFSKLETLGFPVEADILAQIENLKSGKDAVKVTTSQPPVDSTQLLQLLIIALVAYYFKDIMAMIKSYL